MNTTIQQYNNTTTRLVFVGTLFLAFLLTSLMARSQGQGHFKIRKDNYIHIGYDKDKALTFGKGANGKYALEYFDGGFNIFKPTPEANAGNYKFFLNDYGSVSIGGKYATGWYKLSVYGRACFSIYSKSPVHWTTSDKRFKSDIKPIENSLSKVIQLKGYAYKLNLPNEDKRFTPNSETVLTDDQAKRAEQDKLGLKKQNDNKETLSSERQIGFLAQELQQLFPEVVKKDEDGSLMVNYNAIIPVLVEAIKEQQIRIEALEKKLNK